MITVAKGDKFIVYPDARPAERLFISVVRVSRHREWADIRCYTPRGAQIKQ